MLDSAKKRYRFRMVDPVYPAFNVYSFNARRTTPLGAVCAASAVNDMPGWDAEVIEENNLRRFGTFPSAGGADHELLQNTRPADAAGLCGGLTKHDPQTKRKNKNTKI